MAAAALVATEEQGSARRSSSSSSTLRSMSPLLAKRGPTILAKVPTASSSALTRTAFSPKTCVLEWLDLLMMIQYRERLAQRLQLGMCSL